MKTNQITREIYTPGLSILKREDGTDSRIITGYAIVFGRESVPLWYDGDIPTVEVIDRDAITQDLLDSSDIKFTMFHDRQIILARSDKGQGTLSYEIDEHGVKFEFEAPANMYGDYALDSVKRGDIKGCSFAFGCRYSDRECVERIVEADKVTYRVKKIEGIYDMTLAADPAYPQTSVELREALAQEPTPAAPKLSEEAAAQIAEMRANLKTL